MSRKESVKRGVRHLIDPNNRDEYVPTLGNVLGRVYDEGFLDGSGQSSISALEREVIVAALEWRADNTKFMEHKLFAATNALAVALEKAETE